MSLDECRELARERGVDWLVLASEFAQRMLPQIFRAGDPVLEVALPPETRQQLEAILGALPGVVFIADDSLGWVYQFWQADQKDAVNASENKIGADELPVVTQLFTEDYMVLFLLHNTLGAWWAGKVLEARPRALGRIGGRVPCRVRCAGHRVELLALRAPGPRRRQCMAARCGHVSWLAYIREGPHRARPMHGQRTFPRVRAAYAGCAAERGGEALHR